MRIIYLVVLVVFIGCKSPSENQQDSVKSEPQALAVSGTDGITFINYSTESISIDGLQEDSPRELVSSANTLLLLDRADEQTQVSVLDSSDVVQPLTSLPASVKSVAYIKGYLLATTEDSLLTYRSDQEGSITQLSSHHYGSLPNLYGEQTGLGTVIAGPSSRTAYVLDTAVGRVYNMGLRSDGSAVYPLSRSYMEIGSTCVPTDLVFHPDRERFYLLCSESNLVIAGFYNDSTGVLTKRSTLQTIPVGHQGNRSTDLAISEDGRFLYAANRELGTIALFAIDAGPVISFLQFLQMPNPGDMQLLPIGSELLITHRQSDLVYRAIHGSDLKLVVKDSIAIAGPTAIARR